jgi:hypothetical protein
MFRYATEYYYQKKIARLEAKIAELQNKLADWSGRRYDDGK